MKIGGVHHVTAIADDPNRNIAFYTQILGLKLVKLTVNFDDPSTYHLYYGDEIGRPGTLLTFFVWPGAQRGRDGHGQLAAVAFAIPRGSMSFWIERLRKHETLIQGPAKRFDEEVLTVYDPDGLRLELVEVSTAVTKGVCKNCSIPVDQAIIGLHAVTVLEASRARTDSLLTQTLGFQFMNEESNRIRYLPGPVDGGTVLDLVHVPIYLFPRTRRSSVRDSD
jgi:glyoxalase family protein